MFGKKVNPENFRSHVRYKPNRMSAIVDGVECELLDYSEGGVRISSPRTTRRVALIEIYKSGRCIRKSPAIVAWRNGAQVGYAFRSNLKVCEIEATAMQPQAKEHPEESTGRNESGAVAGDALRRRLRM